jgi:hypothetical protein
MRIFISKLLVAGALFFFSASSASALAISLGGLDATAAPGGTVSVTVTIDTEALTGITLLSVGVLFDDTKLSFNQAASANVTSYALFGARGVGFLQASDLCGGYPAPGGVLANDGACQLRVNTTNQVNIDYVSASLGGGTATTGSWLATTLVFNVLPATSGTAAISLTTSSPGNTIALAGGAQGTATLTGAGVVNVPEPTTALLIGLGLAGLGIAGRRRA